MNKSLKQEIAEAKKALEFDKWNDFETHLRSIMRLSASLDASDESYVVECNELNEAITLKFAEVAHTIPSSLSKTMDAFRMELFGIECILSQLKSSEEADIISDEVKNIKAMWKSEKYVAVTTGLHKINELIKTSSISVYNWPHIVDLHQFFDNEFLAVHTIPGTLSQELETFRSLSSYKS